MVAWAFRLRPASQDQVPRNLQRVWSVWIWFIGAAVWFLNALLGMHRHALGRGLLSAVIAAMFLAAGMFYRKQYTRRR
jgi:O-antigen/teichoic acid export membrane protein